MQSKFPKGGLPPVTSPLTALPMQDTDAGAPDSALSAAFTKQLGARTARDHLGEGKNGAKGLAKLRKNGQLNDAPRAAPAPPVRSGPRMGHK